VTHRADLERWVDEHYDRVALSRYDRVFVRKKSEAFSDGVESRAH